MNHHLSESAIAYIVQIEVSTEIWTARDSLVMSALIATNHGRLRMNEPHIPPGLSDLRRLI